MRDSRSEGTDSGSIGSGSALPNPPLQRTDASLAALLLASAAERQYRWTDSMIGYLLIAGSVALGGVGGSWKSWSATDPVFKQSWRGWTIRALLGAVALTLLAFAFHLASAMADWTYLPRGPFDDFVRLCFCVSFVPVLAVAMDIVNPSRTCRRSREARVDG